MARVRKHEAARRDLVAQWVWYAENASVEVADRFLAAVESTLSILTEQPESGREIQHGNDRLKGIRRFPVSGGFEATLLFYIADADGVELVRVIHGNRDWSRLLATDFLN